MATASQAPPAPAEAERVAPPPSRRFHSGREWIESLGNVPLDRIVFDPWPGTATEADLLAFCEGEPKRLCELVDGTLVEKPVGFSEGRIAAILLSRLEVFASDHELGLVFGADTTMRMKTIGRIRVPDVSFFSSNRLPDGKLPVEKVPALSPDLAVEVLSESNTRAEMRQKLAEYFDNGTRLAWIIDPKTRTVAVHMDGTGEPATVLHEADTLDGGEVLPGFQVNVAILFKDLPA